MARHCATPASVREVRELALGQPQEVYGPLVGIICGKGKYVKVNTGRLEIIFVQLSITGGSTQIKEIIWLIPGNQLVD